MNYYVVYSLDGYDEISLTGDFKAITMNENKTFSPKALGLPLVKPEDISGGHTVEDSVKVFQGILKGDGTEAQNNVIIANAAFGLRCFYPQKTIRECVEIARDSIKSGKAYQCLKTLIDLQK
jgi:anthranilate phosphoribosyltransferase